MQDEGKWIWRSYARNRYEHNLHRHLFSHTKSRHCETALFVYRTAKSKLYRKWITHSGGQSYKLLCHDETLKQSCCEFQQISAKAALSVNILIYFPKLNNQSRPKQNNKIGFEILYLQYLESIKLFYNSRFAKYVILFRSALHTCAIFILINFLE